MISCHNQFRKELADMSNKILSIATKYFHNILVIFTFLLLSNITGFAQDKALKWDQSATEIDKLFFALKAAPNESIGRQVENEIWKIWRKGPNAKVALLLKSAIRKRETYNLDGALAILNSIIRSTPKFAEAWNQRGFVYFLKGDLESSLADLEKTIELEPRHFGAMAGQAIILLRQGRQILAHSRLRKALEIHPWLKERHMLPR